MACKPVRTHIFRDFTLARAALLSLLIAAAIGLSPTASEPGPLAEAKTDPVMRIVPALFHLGKDCDTDLGVRL
jgi:hypothetical protein